MSDSPIREPRNSVILYARIDHADRSVEVRVRNLSATGACIENPGELNQGDQVSATMGTLVRLSAEVMWTSATLAGLHFVDGAIDLAEARKPRDRGVTGAKPSAGWIDNMQHAYRRRDG
jgi:hypothetical protein